QAAPEPEKVSKMADAVRPSNLDPKIAARLKRDANGLVAAVAQQHDTGEVLMVAWMDDEALHRTLTTGRCTYWSRSRQEYWVKGDTSGHVQVVKSVALDCDGDAILVRVDQTGGACHTGDRTCFDADVLRLAVTSLDDLLALMPFAATMGITLEEAAPERVTARLAWAADRCTAGGLLHG